MSWDDTDPDSYYDATDGFRFPNPYFGYTRRKIPTCKFCGQTHLHWGKNEYTDRWQLEDFDFEEDEWVPHVCQTAKRFSMLTATSSQQTRATSLTV